MKIQGIKEVVQFPVGEIFLFSKMSKLAMEPTQSSKQWARGIFPRNGIQYVSLNPCSCFNFGELLSI